MNRNSHSPSKHLCAVVVAWLLPFAWLIFAPQSDAVHRTLLALAITSTVILYVDYRAIERDVLLRLGVWAGVGQRDSGRCVEMRDSDPA